MSPTNATKIAKIVKGVANAHRVRILLFLSTTPDLSVSELADKLNLNFRTASEHTRKLVSAGLIKKRYSMNFVTHQLTPLGEKMLIAIDQLSE